MSLFFKFIFIDCHVPVTVKSIFVHLSGFSFNEGCFKVEN